jgi:hypothetical protein
MSRLACLQRDLGRCHNREPSHDLTSQLPTPHSHTVVQQLPTPEVTVELLSPNPYLYCELSWYI